MMAQSQHVQKKWCKSRLLFTRLTSARQKNVKLYLAMRDLFFLLACKEKLLNLSTRGHRQNRDRIWVQFFQDLGVTRENEKKGTFEKGKSCLAIPFLAPKGPFLAFFLMFLQQNGILPCRRPTFLKIRIFKSNACYVFLSRFWRHAVNFIIVSQIWLKPRVLVGTHTKSFFGK